MLARQCVVFGLFSLLGSTVACSSPNESSELGLGTVQNEIIGGFPVRSSAADAVGALGIYDPTSTDKYKNFFPVCTASLISRRSVLTAKHCIELFDFGYSLAFGIGYDSTTPKEIVPVVAVRGAPGDEGGLSGYGRDIGVAELGREVRRVTPLDLGILADTDIGKTFAMVGYGDQDDQGTFGTRQAAFAELRAREGKVLQIVYSSFEELYEAHTGEPPPSDCSCAGSDENEACGLACELMDEYENTMLEEGYEVLVDSSESNADLCFGDSGGPLIGLRDGCPVTLGVALLTFGSGGDSCENSKGAVYATFGPEVWQFIQDTK